MTLRIHQATLADIAFLCDMRLEVLRAVFKLSETQDLSELRKSNEDYYRRALLDGSHVTCLLYDDDQFVACGAFCLQEEMPSPDNPNGRCAFIMNIYTRPSFRGNGAAATVVTWLIDQAKQREATKIYLETTEEARSLYQSCGFVEMDGYLVLANEGAELL